MLQGLANRLGDRFKPDPGWVQFRSTVAVDEPHA
jgi:hypothetical protein